MQKLVRPCQDATTSDLRYDFGMQSRREFGLTLAGLISSPGMEASRAAALAPSGTRTRLPSDQVAAQVYVFTQHYRRQEQALRDHVPEMLAAHRDAGIHNIELVADLLDPALDAELRQGMAEYGQRYPVVYSGARLFETERHAGEAERMRRLAGRAAKLGARFVNCNPDPKPQKARKSDDELRAEVDGIHRVARAVRQEGLTLLLHNHDAEMQENARNWRFWLAQTDPGLVSFCLDTHWVYRGGQDALELVRACRPRVEALHLRNSRGKIWWEEFDDGDLNYRPLADLLNETRYNGLLTIELAWDPDTVITRSLSENLRRSRGYLERRFL